MQEIILAGTKTLHLNICRFQLCRHALTPLAGL